MTATPFSRILLKLSGESLMGEAGYGMDPARLAEIAYAIKQVRELGVEVAIVVGGGNIFRGMAESAKGMDRASADYAGLLATVLTGIAVQDACERIGVFTRVLSALDIQEVAEPYIPRRAIRHRILQTKQAIAQHFSINRLTRGEMEIKRGGRIASPRGNGAQAGALQPRFGEKRLGGGKDMVSLGGVLVGAGH